MCTVCMEYIWYVCVYENMCVCVCVCHLGSCVEKLPIVGVGRTALWFGLRRHGISETHCTTWWPPLSTALSLSPTTALRFTPLLPVAAQLSARRNQGISQKHVLY